MSTDKSTSFRPHFHIAKSATVIGFATLCSRMLGFIRDVVIARLFGVYVYAQAFVVAFKIPNLFRDLLGEGASNAAFVPVFSEYNAKHSKEEFWDLANVVLNLLLVVLAVVTIIGVILAPLIVRLIAPGFSADPDKLATTIKLSRIIFPYVLLICLSAYAMGILNSLRNFSVSAFAPCLLNISIIICALIFGEGVIGLSSGVLIGGFLQLAIQVPVLYRKGFRLNLFHKFRHPAANTIAKLMMPRLLSSSIYQLNNFIDSIFGSLSWIIGDGAVAVLYFSYRLIQFPLGIFSTALSQAILPVFSTQALDKNSDSMKVTLSWGLRVTFFVMLPASVFFIFLAKPIISGLFQGGRFDLNSVQLTSSALLFYSIGLFAYAGTKILQNCFFALKDTVTPMKVSALALAMNILLNTILIFMMKISGIALATSISGIASFFILFRALKNKIGDLPIEEISESFMRTLSASICMGLAIFFIGNNLIIDQGVISKIINLCILCIAGFIFYIIFCLIFRVRELRQAYSFLSKRNLK